MRIEEWPQKDTKRHEKENNPGGFGHRTFLLLYCVLSGFDSADCDFGAGRRFRAKLTGLAGTISAAPSQLSALAALAALAALPAACLVFSDCPAPTIGAKSSRQQRRQTIGVDLDELIFIFIRTRRSPVISPSRQSW